MKARNLYTTGLCVSDGIWRDVSLEKVIWSEGMESLEY